MSSEAVERKGSEPQKQSDIVRLIADAIKRSNAIADVQRGRLLQELQPVFESLNKYSSLYEGFVSDVGSVEEEEEDIHEEIVDESLRRVFGFSVDDLSAMDRRRLDDVFDEFGQCKAIRSIDDLVDQFQVKVDNLELG